MAHRHTYTHARAVSLALKCCVIGPSPMHYSQCECSEFSRELQVERDNPIVKGVVTAVNDV